MRTTSETGNRTVALLGAFVAVSMVCGLLLAGLALPATWATGSVASAGVDLFDSLPDELAEPPLQAQSTVLDAGGRPIARFYDEHRIPVTLPNISPHMRRAIVAIEDSRFYEHGGVDPKGLLRAFVSNQVNDKVQGASTLTQQYIKLRILEAASSKGDVAAQRAALAQNYSRKVQEVRLALALERKKSKDEILAGYLNIANFGDSTYGVEAAAQYFFNGTTAKDLTLPQAALLAGLVQSPEAYNPFKHPQAALHRRNVVLARMAEVGAITPAEYDTARRAPMGAKRAPSHKGCYNSSFAYYCAYVRNLIIKDQGFSALGTSEEDRAKFLDQGGLTIRTTLVPKIQEAAQAAVDDKVSPTNSIQAGAAAVTVEPGTGRVLAMTENRRFNPEQANGNTEINYSVDRDLGSGAGFQPGSTFKPFTLAAWLAKGKGLYDVVDASRTTRSFNEFKGCDGPLGGPPYHFENSEGGGAGSMTVMEATADSVNTAFVDMASHISLCDIADVATKLGVHKAYPYDAGECQGSQTTKLPDCTPSMVLGSVNVAPLTMAAAYAGFAADGKYCTPLAVLSITDRDGKQLPVPKGSCNQAIDPNVAHGVTFALKPVLTSGTAAGNGIGRPAAGKTGTTDNSVDTWFVGYTPQFSTAVWVGDNPNPEDGRQRRSLNGRLRGGHVFGATIAAPIWRSIMQTASEGLPERDWPRPTGKLLEGSGVRLPSVVGMPVDQAAGALTAQGFKVNVGGTVPSDIGPDRVAQTSPPAGSRVAPGSSITLLRGDGSGGGDQGGPGGPGGDQGGPGGGPGGNQGGPGGGRGRGGGGGGGGGGGNAVDLQNPIRPGTTGKPATRPSTGAG